MIPFKDNLLYIARPTITSALIILNCLFFIVETALLESGRHYAALVQDYGMFTPAHVTSAYASADPLAMLLVTCTLFTAMFLHGGLMHIFGNMVFLSCFGRAVEARLGKRQFLAFYVFAGLAAAAGQYLVNPLSEIPGLGASGAIAGVLSAYMIFFPRAKIVGFSSQTGIASAPAWSFLLVWIGMQFVDMIFQKPGAVGGVAYMEHIGGFVFGVLAGVLARWYQPVQVVRYADEFGMPIHYDSTGGAKHRMWTRLKLTGARLSQNVLVSGIKHITHAVSAAVKQKTLRIRQRKSLSGSHPSA